MTTSTGSKRSAVLEGLGGYLPPEVVTNEMLQSRLDTTDAWIRARAGIQSRHIACPEMATSDLAVEAGRRALRSAGTDLVILVTTTFRMAGREVFAGAVRAMADSSRAVLKEVQWAPGDVDLLVAHQANLRILMAVAETLGIARHRAAVHLDRVVNTSAASISLAMADADIRPGSRVLLTAFGGGTAWGSAALVWGAWQ